MTEDQAKTKWCPFSRVPAVYQGTSEIAMGAPVLNRNQAGRPLETMCCIGSACMAWRETMSGRPARQEMRREGGPTADDPLGQSGNQVLTDIPAMPASGYCGLAIKPERGW